MAVFRYSGPSYQPAFNAYLFSHGWWSYSDIASLWFRDHLRHHPVPYFDYRLEYPVVTGALIGLVSQITSSVSSYFVATSAVLAGCAAGFVALVRRIPNACGWLFALSPTLLLYGVTNWDLLGLLPTAGALVLYLRRRDLPASALLAVAASTKLFPALLLPFVLLVQVREGRVNAALRSAGVFVAVTLALNVVPAIAAWRNWSYFFTYNDSRHPELSVWRLVAHGLHTGQVNEISELLGAPATLENRDFELIAFGAYDSEGDLDASALDPVRTRSVRCSQDRSRPAAAPSAPRTPATPPNRRCAADTGLRWPIPSRVRAAAPRSALR